MASSRSSQTALWGLFWIFIGLLVLAHNYEYISFDLTWDRDWPLIFVLIGVMFLLRGVGRSRRHRDRDEWRDENSGVVAVGGSSGARKRMLKVRVFESDSAEPKVRVNVPLSVVKLGMKMSGACHNALPDEVQEKLRDKGIQFDREMFDNIDTALDELEEGGRIDVVDVFDAEDGERVHVYIE